MFNIVRMAEIPSHVLICRYVFKQHESGLTTSKNLNTHSQIFPTDLETNINIVQDAFEDVCKVIAKV